MWLYFKGDAVTLQEYCRPSLGRAGLMHRAEQRRSSSPESSERTVPDSTGWTALSMAEELDAPMVATPHHDTELYVC